MSKLFFKSTDADLQKFSQSNTLILSVLRQQRVQLDRIEYLVKRLLNDSGLQKQISEYYDRDDSSPPEDAEPD